MSNYCSLINKMDKSKSLKKPIYEGDPNVFDVDQLLRKRQNGTKTEYFVKWLGYPDSENSWVEESNITDDLIEEFNSKETNRPEESSATVVLPLATNEESVLESVPEEHSESGSYFEENFHNLGPNVLLLSASEHFQLLPADTTSNGSNVNISQDQSIEESIISSTESRQSY